MTPVPFTVQAPNTPRPAPSPVALRADRRLYLAVDECTMVEEGDVRARYLLCSANAVVPAHDVARLGLALTDGRLTQPAKSATVPDAPNVDAKMRTPAEDKMDAPTENKGGKRERK